MSTEAALLSLSATISGLQSQIDDLKQDKRDLRSDKESLKAEVVHLKEQLRAALVEAARLNEELQVTSAIAEEWKKLCELAMNEHAQKAQDKTSHEVTSVQMHPGSGPTPTPTVVDLVPEASPLTSILRTHSPALNDSPPSQVIEDDSTGPPASRTRKRKALTNGDANETPQKRSSRIAQLNTNAQRQSSGPSSSGLEEASTSSRPDIQYNEDVAVVLPPHILQHYLDLTPPLPISPAPSNLHVSREFLGDIYGGSPKQSAQHVGAFENPTEDCHRAFTFPQVELNPGMPLVPGHGGVIIASKYDRKTGHPWGLFRKDLTGATQTWMYVGEYEWTAMGKVSAETFRRQKDQVKQNWADELLGWKMGVGEYYPAMRARIALRKAGILPASDICQHDTLVKEELGRIRSRIGHPVDRDDIITAFERGEEALDVTLLRCVAYDRTLAMDIENKFTSPPPRVKRTKKKGYRYPTDFQSLAAHGHKPSAKKRRAMPPAQPAEALPPMTTTTGAQAPPRGSPSPSVLALNIGISDDEDTLDDGLSYVSEDEVSELSCP